MTKSEWTSLVRQRTKQMNHDIEWRVVEASCNAAYTALLDELSRRNIIELDAYSRQYKNVTVSKDTDTNVKYSVIPDNIVPFSNPQEGVREIATMQETGIEFYPISNKDLRYTQDLDINLIDGAVGYTLIQNSDGNRIVEYNGCPDSVTSVKMRLVIPFTSYGEDQEVMIPSGTDNKYKFLDLAINYLLGMQPKDKANNNSEIPLK